MLKGKTAFQTDLGMLKEQATRNQALHSGVWQKDERSRGGVTWVVPRPEMGDWCKWQIASSEETSGIRQGAKLSKTPSNKTPPE
ncbi:hypothetical protein llap_5635 [Limosa lapponica baueri]|uniref:Uncharacterized protein n=1 Tax=Limosa lapponica baueri TaxID=1758121 RepID=A0A2I0UDE3_LIMLA|nr:hypothetical protein llap_5635 [Limosa lapponica baueri]